MTPDHIHQIPEGPFSGLFRGTAMGMLLIQALGFTFGIKETLKPSK